MISRINHDFQKGRSEVVIVWADYAIGDDHDGEQPSL